MYGDPQFILLAIRNIMSALLMIIISSLGCTCFPNTKSSHSLNNFSALSNECLIVKSLPCKLIGMANMSASILFFAPSALPTVSYPHTHQQNGVAERKHRHIIEMGLALLATASMPQILGPSLPHSHPNHKSDCVQTHSL